MGNILRKRTGKDRQKAATTATATAAAASDAHSESQQGHSHAHGHKSGGARDVRVLLLGLDNSGKTS